MEDLPPHFPDPNADPMAVLSARIVELEEINAAQYAEMKGWERMHAEAVAKLDALAGHDAAIVPNGPLYLIGETSTEHFDWSRK
jgi:hypothetical protein